MISIEAVGFREATGRFARMRTSLQAAQAAAIAAAATTLRDALQEEAPRSDGPGPHLADQFMVRLHAGGADVVAAGDKAGLIPLIVQGTPPHVIRARRGQALAFASSGPSGAGGIYFFRQVNHPGTRPNDFVGRAFVRTQATVREQINRVAAETLLTRE